jgi:hypothetical protein
MSIEGTEIEGVRVIDLGEKGRRGQVLPFAFADYEGRGGEGDTHNRIT